MSKSKTRELTKEEKREIKQLVTSICANYDREHGCLPLDYGRCYMLDKCWTGSLCKYFKDAVLPLNHKLEVVLLSSYADLPPAAVSKTCSLCGTAFFGDGRQKYCSSKCAEKATRKANTERSRRYRKNKGPTVTGITQ